MMVYILFTVARRDSGGFIAPELLILTKYVGISAKFPKQW
jgi:hypothetical protein